MTERRDSRNWSRPELLAVVLLPLIKVAIHLWVGAGCLGLTLFKKRNAMLDKLFGRKGQPAIPTSEV